jgi:NodT family efflux transporter outer membrane factor (OMF) lipoprotein
MSAHSGARGNLGWRSPESGSAPSRRRHPPELVPAVLVLGAAAALAGCAVGPNYHSPRVPVPNHYDAVPLAEAMRPGSAIQSATTPRVDLASWWRVLNDSELDSLVERAVKANPDALIALDRMQAARTYEVGLTGTALPAVAGGGAYGHGTGHDLTRGLNTEPLVNADDSSGVSHLNTASGFAAVWEIDVFGRIRREIESARDSAQAAAAARNAVLVSVIADVASAYVDLRGLQMRASVLHAAIDVLQQSLRIVTQRYQRGITNELDVTLAQRELASLQAQVAPIDAQVSAAQYTIATLLGQYPEDLVQELQPKRLLPVVPVTIEAGVPLDLLRRRPDIQDSERELAASNADIGVAVASLFPQFLAAGAIGGQRANLGTAGATGKHIWSVGVGGLWPLLDFGQLDAQVQIANLQTRALLVSYKSLIQNAVQQVDAAVVLFAAEQVSLRSLGTALVASQRAVTLANQRYDRGLTDFLNVVDAERQEYVIEEQYVEAQTSVDEQFVALYRSLGGGWQNYQDVPPIVRPLPAVMAIFRDTLAHDHPLQDP